MSRFPERSSRARGYYFLVAALAAFVVVLALGREQGGDHVARATLLPQHDAAAYRPLSLEEIRRLVLDEAVVRQLAENLAPPGTAAESAWAADIARRLIVEPQVGSSQALQLAFADADAERARAVVNLLAESFTKRRSAADLHQMAVAVRQVRQSEAEAVRAAQQELAAARAALADLPGANQELPGSTQHELQFPDSPSSPNLESPGAGASTLGETTTAETTPKATTPGGPETLRQQIELLATQARELDAELEARRQHRQELSLQLTDAHPRMIALDAKIGEVQDQLTAVQDRLAAQRHDLESTYLSGPVNPASAGTDSPDANESIPRAQLVALVNAAEAHLAQHRAAEQAAAEKLKRLTQAPTWRMTHADEAVYRTRPTPLTLLVFSGALALVSGGGMLFATGSVVQTVDSPAVAEQVLGIPVLGSIAVDGARPRLGFRVRAGLVRGVLALFEITLGVFLFGMLLSALLAGDFASQLGSDPLSALADGPASLGRLLLGR